jgi:predicted nucleotidyltransferase
MNGLKGKNQIRKFRQVAQTLVREISQIEGVAGIIFVGGLARGFADKYSDVDVIVFLGKNDGELKKRVRKVESDEAKRSCLDIDLEIHNLVDFRKRKLDEVFLWDLSKAEIAFDPDGDISKLLKAKFHVPGSFWLKRLAVYAEYMKWYCCPRKESVESIAEMWIDRGDSTSAHYCTNYTVDLLVNTLFALNKEFLPAPKWRIFYSYELKWLPKHYERFVKEAIEVKDLSKHSLVQRIDVLKQMWNETMPKIEQETKLTMDALSRYYVKTELKQT